MTDVLPEVVGPRRYRNGESMVAASDPAWQAAAEYGLIGIEADADSNNRFVVRASEHEFVNMCSCAYLGLNYHPAVIEGAITALRESGTTELMTSTTRIKHTLQARLEEELGDLFGAHVLLGTTCSAVTAGILPLIASGHLATGGPRVMVFDRFCHFSMAYVKPICAEESLVLTCDHNDVSYVEDICRRYGSVAYVADGAYSMGGAAALDGFRELQERYGLLLFIDDSHSLSIMGEHGEGFVRSRLKINPLTIIVSSLGKGFGTGGGVAMLNDPAKVSFLARHAGPVGWSQNVTMPMVGASLASAAIHRSPELGELQNTLQSNLDYLDAILPTSLAGNGLPVRRINVGEADEAVRMSAELYRRGFYSSAVFFPIVPRDEAGLRIMVRADLTREQLATFAGHIHELSAGK